MLDHRIGTNNGLIAGAALGLTVLILHYFRTGEYIVDCIINYSISRNRFIHLMSLTCFIAAVRIMWGPFGKWKAFSKISQWVDHQRPNSFSRKISKFLVEIFRNLVPSFVYCMISIIIALNIIIYFNADDYNDLHIISLTIALAALILLHMYIYIIIDNQKYFYRKKLRNIFIAAFFLISIGGVVFTIRDFYLNSGSSSSKCLAVNIIAFIVTALLPYGVKKFRQKLF